MVSMSRQRGFSVMSYILLSVTLLGALSAVLVLSSNRAGKANMSWTTATQIVAQANLLRQKILDCGGQGGHNGTANHPAYPAAATEVAVTTLTCPASGGNLFTGADGVFLPPVPAGFSPWRYVNDGTSVRIRLQVTNLATATPQSKAANVASYAAAIDAAVSQFGSAASRATAITPGDTFNLVITN